MPDGTLLISDFHNKINLVNKILKEASYDKVVFLGDGFDSYGDSEKEAVVTATWFKANIDNPKYTFLTGNHDLAFMFPNNHHARCPGWSPEKNYHVNSILTQKDWGKFKFFVEEQGFWLTHAGVSSFMFGPKPTQDLVENILKLAVKRVARGEYAPELCDWTHSVLWERNCPLIKGVKQVYAHSYGEEVRAVIKSKDTMNICLDTANQHYGIIKDGEFFFASINDHKLRPVEEAAGFPLTGGIRGYE